MFQTSSPSNGFSWQHESNWKAVSFPCRLWSKYHKYLMVSFILMIIDFVEMSLMQCAWKTTNEPAINSTKNGWLGEEEWSVGITMKNWRGNERVYWIGFWTFEAGFESFECRQFEEKGANNSKQWYQKRRKRACISSNAWHTEKVWWMAQKEGLMDGR